MPTNAQEPVLPVEVPDSHASPCQWPGCPEPAARMMGGIRLCRGHAAKQRVLSLETKVLPLRRVLGELNPSHPWRSGYLTKLAAAEDALERARKPMERKPRRRKDENSAASR